MSAIVESVKDIETQPQTDVANANTKGGRKGRKVLILVFDVVMILLFLYFFLVSLDLLASGMNVMLGDSAATLFNFADNPLAGLTVGILCTVLVQSSSTTTSLVVTMVGAGVLSVEQGIYFIFGANIGTSVTNSIVTLSFMNNPVNYQRGFAAATVHDMFNFLNVALFFPLEWISDAINGGNGGIMYLMTEAMTSNWQGQDGEDWTSPFKTITRAITDKMIQPNRRVLEDYAQGRPSVEQCEEFLCVSEFECMPYRFNDRRCSNSVYATPETQCDGSNANANAEFAFCINEYTANQTILNAAQEHFDAGEPNSGGVFYPMQTAAGVICFLIALFMMFTSMLLMVKFLNRVFRGSAEGCVKKALNTNGYLGILIGTGITMLVQSSSITTATLTPLAAIGIVSLESMLPLTLGANIGTTITGILASMVSTNVDAFQIALVHLMFNVFGVILFYPIPFFRRIPIRAAERLGEFAFVSKVIPVLYIFLVFFFLPACLLCLSLLFTLAGTGGVIAGSILTVLLFGVLVAFGYWFKRKGGSKKLDAWMSARYAAVEDRNKAESDRSSAEQESTNQVL